jgi:hypothetical protein
MMTDEIFPEESCAICIDENRVRVHDVRGSKRFEGQRAWQEVANPEHRSAANRFTSKAAGSEGRSGNLLGQTSSAGTGPSATIRRGREIPKGSESPETDDGFRCKHRTTGGVRRTYLGRQKSRTGAGARNRTGSGPHRECLEDAGRERRPGCGDALQEGSSPLASERPYRKASFYWIGNADEQQRSDPLPAKTGGGELRAQRPGDSDATFRPCMPAGEQVV